MTLLDGTDLDSALTSLGEAAGIDAEAVKIAILSYDDSAFVPSMDESPAWAIPRQIFARLGVDVDALAFAAGRYFHGTRVLEPANFLTRGILALDQMLDELWTTLYELIADERTETEWADFREWVAGGGGDYGYLHRMKVGGRIHHGPHGTFVRERLLNPTPPAHDYLGGPETVEDIASCYAERFGGDLLGRFLRTSEPCIVAFDSSLVESAGINSVFWLAFGLLREGEVGSNADGGIALDGVPVTPDQVAWVELCEPAGEPSYRVVERIEPPT